MNARKHPSYEPGTKPRKQPHNKQFRSSLVPICRTPAVRRSHDKRAPAPWHAANAHERSCEHACRKFRARLTGVDIPGALPPSPRLLRQACRMLPPLRRCVDKRRAHLRATVPPPGHAPHARLRVPHATGLPRELTARQYQLPPLHCRALLVRAALGAAPHVSSALIYSSACHTALTW